VVAGLEPASAIGNGIHTLLAHHDQLRELIHEPSLFGNAVEEILRFEPPFRFLPQRLTIKPVQLGDVTIPAGEFVLLSLAAAGRDPSRFDDPDTFDVKRDCSGHLSFGHGRHRCIGSALGRLQLETALRRLFLRFPEARLAFPEREVGWRPGKFMRRLEQLFVIL
jgi:cytochrome P450 PksS